MQRPGPLRDIPLDRINFVDNASHPLPFKQRPNKRPLSPNASHVCSPAKRQEVWRESGYSAARTPQPIVWSSKDGEHTPLRPRVALLPVVVTPRKLDFGIAKSEDSSHATPVGDAQRRQESSGSVAPLLSPDAMDIDDYFSPKLAPAWHGNEYTPVAATTTRDSIHYPGFDICLDKSNALISPSPPLSPRKPSPNTGGASRRTRDVDKENVPPRVKLARAVKASLEAVELENLPVKLTCFEESSSHPSSSVMTGGGFDYALKSKLDTHNLADRGHGLPWLKSGQTVIDDETMEVSGLSLEDEMTGRGWED